MYEKITGEDGYEQPMRIYPAVHYTMGGLWVDYNLMSNVPGLHVLGEANFSDHGANRLGASALMQGLADGYFVIPTTIANYLATSKARQRQDRASGIQEGARKLHGARSASSTSKESAPWTASTANSASHVGQMRHGPRPRRPHRGSQTHPRAA
jgi:succinate dehydrogenase/fumarate reductase flavoprotein subunit